jgi:hypothetical protein
MVRSGIQGPQDPLAHAIGFTNSLFDTGALLRTENYGRKLKTIFVLPLPGIVRREWRRAIPIVKPILSAALIAVQPRSIRAKRDQVRQQYAIHAEMPTELRP